MVTVSFPVQQAHRQATEATISEIAELLQDVLSRQITAYIAGVKNGKTVSRWANGEVTEIRDYRVEQRIRTAYEMVQLLLPVDSARVVRAWFIGMNPYLDDTSPAQTVRDGNFSEALTAAHQFLAYG